MSRTFPPRIDTEYFVAYWWPPEYSMYLLLSEKVVEGAANKMYFFPAVFRKCLRL